MTGAAMKEAQHINKSLSALGQLPCSNYRSRAERAYMLDYCHV